MDMGQRTSYLRCWKCNFSAMEKDLTQPNHRSYFKLLNTAKESGHFFPYTAYLENLLMNEKKNIYIYIHINKYIYIYISINIYIQGDSRVLSENLKSASLRNSKQKILYQYMCFKS